MKASTLLILAAVAAVVLYFVLRKRSAPQTYGMGAYQPGPSGGQMPADFAPGRGPSTQDQITGLVATACTAGATASGYGAAAPLCGPAAQLAVVGGKYAAKGAVVVAKDTAKVTAAGAKAVYSGGKAVGSGLVSGVKKLKFW